MRQATPIVSLSLAALALTGCYTQLATRGYATVESPAQAKASALQDSAPGDSLSGYATPVAPGAADTLAPRSAAPTVIVNNYYDPSPYYRGYAHWEWDYPLISVGYYSSRFDRFHRPWWWDDPGYHRRPHHRVHDSRPIHVTPRPAGPYKSPVRLYNQEPDYPTLRRGRRADTPAYPSPGRAAPAPQVQAAEPAPVRTEPAPATQPAPKSSSTPAASSSNEEEETPTLKKGRRR